MAQALSHAHDADSNLRFVNGSSMIWPLNTNGFVPCTEIGESGDMLRATAAAAFRQRRAPASTHRRTCWAYTTDVQVLNDGDRSFETLAGGRCARAP